MLRGTEPDPRPLLKLVHTSDVHIGDGMMNEARLAGLRGVIDAAIACEADALIIAGDLFDNARVKPREIGPALEQLARVSMPIFLTPGNHDCLEPPSIWDRVSPAAEAGEHVHFFDEPEGRHFVLEGLRLTVWSRALVEHCPANQPLLGYERRIDSHWQIALAHGHYFAADDPPDRSSPLLAPEIGRLECDYLALGHWHRFKDVSVGETVACYPGSPSEPGGSYASANLVTLDPVSGVRVERIALPK